MAVDSRLRLWRASNDYITLDYAQARPVYAEHGERIRDRLGLMHRVCPDTERYPVGLNLLLLPEELTLQNNEDAVVRRSVLDWLELWYQQSVEIVVYVLGQSLATDGSQLERLLAYKGIIDSLPEEGFGSLPLRPGGAESSELSLLVTQDGRFSDFDSLASYIPRERPGG